MKLKTIFSVYGFAFPITLVYMLQSVEYRVGPYLSWFWQTNDFSAVSKRRQLVRTRSASYLLLGLRIGISLQVIAGLGLVLADWRYGWAGGFALGAALILSAPVVWAHLVAVPLLAGRWLFVVPRERRLIVQANKIFAKHPGAKIAVAGSYGKTSMKELLATVLSEGKTVAATPANKNVSVSHARFARQLTGKEDVLIIEYGEGAPGDVARFAARTHPTHAVITGLAPAHLDRYKTLKAAGRDIFSVADYLHDQNVYVNAESSDLADFIKPSHVKYDRRGVGTWRVKAVSLSVEGTAFTLRNEAQELQLKSGLLGEHQVGPLAFAAVFALELGLTPDQVTAGIAKTVAYEHRMQPYGLGGATIIDDSYNGNLEGIRAGTALLSGLNAKRKIYVTPGLVDQGKETVRVHREMGELIAAAKPDVVVLMQNSVTPYIIEGLKKSDYKGDIQLEADPLNFYTNLDQWVAADDLLLMQNDWTDNYH